MAGNYPQPMATPNPAEVGARLMAHQQQQQGMDPMAGMPQPPMGMLPVGEPSSVEPWESASEAALKSAIMRLPNFRAPQNQRPPAVGSRQQLQRLGLPDNEIELLKAQGGSNV